MCKVGIYLNTRLLDGRSLEGFLANYPVYSTPVKVIGGSQQTELPVILRKSPRRSDVAEIFIDPESYVEALKENKNGNTPLRIYMVPIERLHGKTNLQDFPKRLEGCQSRYSMEWIEWCAENNALSALAEESIKMAKEISTMTAQTEVVEMVQ